VIPTNMPTWQPFIGAGVAAHMLKWEMEGADALLGSMDFSETKIGYHVGGGMSFNVHEQVDLMTSAWYSVVEDFNQTTVRAGFAIRL
jgi:opacity protein-like surface antigen